MVFATEKMALDQIAEEFGLGQKETIFNEDKEFRINPIFSALLKNKNVSKEEKDEIRHAIDNQTAYRFKTAGGREQCVVIMPFGKFFLAYLADPKSHRPIKL